MEKLDLILIADDDPTALFLVKSLLRRSLAADRIITAHNGQVALELVIEHCCGQLRGPDCPTLILVDIQMPVMGGFAFVEALSTLEMDCKPIVAMLSTSYSLKDRETAERLGVRGYFEKPLDVGALTRFLASTPA